MDSTPSRSIARPRLVRRWPVALVVLISISAVAFTAAWLKTHVEHAEHIATPAEIRAYPRSVCYAAENGLPHPEPLYVGNGNWISAHCDVMP
jgi:hypothetical protein